PATKDPFSWISRLSLRSRTLSCSHNGGCANDLSYCSIRSGIFDSSVLYVFAIDLSVSFQSGINVRFGVEQDPVQQVAALFAVLEEHQRGHAQDGHEILHHHVHRQSEHLAVQKPTEDVHHNCHGQDGEQILCFQSEECDSGAQVAVNGCDIECHRFLPLPFG